MAYGVVYIARNDSDPDKVFKIGKTTKSVEERMKELTSDTSNVGKYEQVGYVVVNDIDFVEKEVFKKLADYRVQPNREFFKCNLSEIISAIRNESRNYLVKDSLPIEEEIDINFLFEEDGLTRNKAKRESIENTEKAYNSVIKIKRDTQKFIKELNENIKTSLKGKYAESAYITSLIDENFSIDEWINNIKEYKGSNEGRAFWDIQQTIPLMELRLNRKIKIEIDQSVFNFDNKASTDLTRSAGQMLTDLNQHQIEHIITFLREQEDIKPKSHYQKYLKKFSKYASAQRELNTQDKKNFTKDQLIDEWESIVEEDQAVLGSWTEYQKKEITKNREEYGYILEKNQLSLKEGFKVCFEFFKYLFDSNSLTKEEVVTFLKIRASIFPTVNVDEYENVFILPRILIEPELGNLSLVKQILDKVKYIRLIIKEDHWNLEKDCKIEVFYSSPDVWIPTEIDQAFSTITKFYLQNANNLEEGVYEIKFEAFIQNKEPTACTEIDPSNKFLKENGLLLNFESLQNITDHKEEIRDFFSLNL